MYKVELMVKIKKISTNFATTIYTATVLFFNQIVCQGFLVKWIKRNPLILWLLLFEQIEKAHGIHSTISWFLVGLGCVDGVS